MDIITRLIGVVLVLIFGFALKGFIQHENTFDNKFGEDYEMEWDEDLGRNVFKYPEREFRRQDEDMAQVVGIIVSFIVVLVGVYLIFK